MDNPTVIVGAGSAGSVIAARLGEHPAQQVILLEAGPDYPDGSLPPDLSNGHNNSYRRHDWGLSYKPTASARDDIPLPRGRVVGGSSAVNTCIALRGAPEDYDGWAAIAGEQWGWSQCLPAFKRLETDLDIQNDLHGDSGPLPIRRYRDDELVPFQAAAMRAFGELGYPHCPDHNDPSTTGWGPHPMNKIDGRRISTAEAYLAPARNRKNLQIRANTHVRRVVIRSGRVRGVEVMTEDSLETIDCARLVLSAGAIMTPAILVRSGVGPRRLLDALEITPVAERAGVGEHLIDHPAALVGFAPTPEFAHALPDEVPIIQTTLRYTAAGSDERNDMQLEPLSFLGFKPSSDLMGLAVVVERPRTSGRLRIFSADPFVKPLPEANLGGNEWDIARLVDGLKIALAALETSALSHLVGSLQWPAPRNLESDEAMADWCRKAAGSSYHPCGTARMGDPEDELAVCDGYGRVLGVEGLYVADASLMPEIPRANTNLPSIMIGELFGEWLGAGL